MTDVAVVPPQPCRRRSSRSVGIGDVRLGMSQVSVKSETGR